MGPWSSSRKANGHGTCSLSRTAYWSITLAQLGPPPSRSIFTPSMMGTGKPGYGKGHTGVRQRETKGKKENERAIRAGPAQEWRSSEVIVAGGSFGGSRPLSVDMMVKGGQRARSG